MKVIKGKKYYHLRLTKPNKRKYKGYRIMKIDGVKGVVGITRKKGKRGGRSKLISILIPKSHKRQLKTWERKLKRKR